MYRPRMISSLTTIVLSFLLFTSANAQAPETPAREDVFEARMQFVLGSSGTRGPGQLPEALAPIAAAIRRDFGYQDLSVLETQVGRLANRGAFHTKGAIDLRGRTGAADRPAYTEMRINAPRAEPGGARPNISVQSVAGSIRLPGRTRAVSTEPGRVPEVIYETFSYQGERIPVTDGVPAVVGSISLPDGGTIFVVLTLTAGRN